MKNARNAGVFHGEIILVLLYDKYSWFAGLR